MSMELPWSNILAIANALTGTPWLYFVFYLHLCVNLTCFQVGLLLAYMYFLRWMAANMVIYLFDRLTCHYTLFLVSFCSLVGGSSVMVFYILSTMEAVNYLVLLVFCTLFSVFYLSLGVLVESVILKSWGEYRMYFYGQHRAWSEWTVVFLTSIIGILCFLSSVTLFGDGDSERILLPPLLSGMILVGVLIMCMVALFKLQSMPSDPTTLGLTPSTPWLLKNAVVHPSDLLLLPSYVAPYKPYSLFGEPLSHISEEDASMVQRMTSRSSMMLESGHTSSQSVASSISVSNQYSPSYGAIPPAAPNSPHPAFLSAWFNADPLSARRLSGNTTYSYDPLSNEEGDNVDVGHGDDGSERGETGGMDDQTADFLQEGDHASQYQQLHQPPVSTAAWNAVPSYELALFSFVPPDMPSIAMLPLFLSHLSKHTDDSTNQQQGLSRFSSTTAAHVPPPTTGGRTNIFTSAPSLPPTMLINPPPTDYLKLYSLQSTMFLLGCVSAMLHAFLFVYLYECLNLPMLLIGFVGSCLILPDIVLLTTVTKWVHCMNLTRMTALIHSILIMCSFTFLFLQPDHVTSVIAALILPLLSSCVLYLSWLVASDRINTIVWSDQQRIFHRAILSTIYCCLGPMVGLILTGYLISSSFKGDDEVVFSTFSFSSVYHTSIGLLAFSFVVSWGWSSSDEY